MIDYAATHRHPRPRRPRRAALAGVASAMAALTGLLLAVHGGAAGGERITVHRGDTVWSIALAHPSGDDIAARVQQIEAANHLHGAVLRPGEILTLP